MRGRRRARRGPSTNQTPEVSHAARLRTALGQLPVQQRVVVGLRDVAGCEIPEISEIVQQGPDQVRLLLHGGRSALRNQLEMHFAEVRTA